MSIRRAPLAREDINDRTERSLVPSQHDRYFPRRPDSLRGDFSEFDMAERERLDDIESGTRHVKFRESGSFIGGERWESDKSDGVAWNFAGGEKW